MGRRRKEHVEVLLAVAPNHVVTRHHLTQTSRRDCTARRRSYLSARRHREFLYKKISKLSRY
jgi:hypothetical protein